MKQTKGAIGNLLNRYRAVLRKCHLLNTFGSLAVAGMLVMGSTGMAVAAPALEDNSAQEIDTTWTATEDVDRENVAVIQGEASADKGILQITGSGLTVNGGMNTGADATATINSLSSNNGNVTLEGNFTGNTLASSVDTQPIGVVTAELQAGKTLIITDSNFSGNIVNLTGADNAGQPGGAAVSISGQGSDSHVVISNTTFESNTYNDTPSTAYNGAYGGAVGISNADVTLTKVTFDGNSATNANQIQGGAYYQSTGKLLADEVTVKNQNISTENAAVMGGGMALWGVSADIGANSSFEKNKVTSTSGDLYGGGLYVRGSVWGGDPNVKLTLSDTTFEDNSLTTTNGSAQGGGLYMKGDDPNTYNMTAELSNVEFKSNSVEGETAQGGALFVETVASGTDATATLNHVTFEGNKATGTNALSGGGAIYAKGDLTIKGYSSFSENTTSHYGGAIAMNPNGIAKLDVTDTLFKDNKAGKSGGAIALWFDNENMPEHVIHADFTGNEATEKGGALAVLMMDKPTTGDALKVDISGNFEKNKAGTSGGAIHFEKTAATVQDATFTGNSAGTNGGAIFNDGNSNLTFRGTNTFSDNMAQNSLNDIYNQGKVSIAGGSTTLGSGYVQASGGSSPADGPSLTVNDGATLALQGEATLNIQNGNVTFANNSTFMADASKMTGDSSAITLGSGTTMTVGDKAKLVISNAVSGDTYTVVTDNSGKENGEWKDVSSSTDLIRLDKITEGTDKGAYKATANDATQAFTGLSSDIASQVNAITDVKGDRAYNSEYAGVRFLARATENNTSRFLGNDKAAAVSTIESAARIAFAGAVPQMTKMASDSATNAVVNRMGFANPENGAKAVNVDGKLVDDKALGLALWIAPLWSNQTGFGMEAGNLDYGYNANIGGVSLGADYTWANNFRAGLMFNIGGGYAESSGDLSETTNSMTFWGVGAYGGWKYENFAIMGDVSYTSTWNSVDQDLDHRMQMGDLEADIQASAISAGLRFEYKLETQYLDFIPHVGARYMSINTWGYDVDSADGTILEGDGFQQNIWTFPVGITFSKELEMNNDWYFKPSVDFTVIPAAGDIKAKEDVRFTGPWANSAELETQMMDYFTWQGGVGLEFGNDNMSVGVNYTLQAGQNSTGHGVFGMFRYEF